MEENGKFSIFTEKMHFFWGPFKVFVVPKLAVCQKNFSTACYSYKQKQWKIFESYGKDSFGKVVDTV